MTTPTQLSVYNGALQIIGQKKLSSLTEDTPRRYALDLVWDRNFRETCLSLKGWQWAKRVVKVDYDPALQASFGFQYFIPWPVDYVRTIAISASENFDPPLPGEDFRIEGQYWVCDHQELYLQYVSKDASYGLDYTLWPDHFTRYAEAFLAKQAEQSLTQGAKTAEAEAAFKYWDTKGDEIETQDKGSTKPSAGSWTRSRGGRWGGGAGTGPISGV